ncbi:2-polyprenyl-6-methoxyphenol hydroxylase-like FAD-dependent oxidoreductase [Dietzia sp. 2505]|uniref:FAD-dependent monooxygenase n=1 Tax=Dietzia sp. 2505 TaxID=3156457 RepID=UPI0033908460
MSVSPPTPDSVLVVGAGPVGLVAACELARRGVTVRVVDKLMAPTNQSRAVAVHAASLEMLDRLGVAEELIATGVTSAGMKIVSGGSTLVTVPLDSIDSVYPFTLITAQTETERVLTTRLEALGASVERGREVVDLTQDADRVQVTVRTDSGDTETVDAGWVVAADGARSATRHFLGTKLADGDFHGHHFLLGDVDAHHHLGDVHMHTFLHPDGPVIALPMVGGRLRLVAQLHNAPVTPPGAVPERAELQEILDRRIGGVIITRSHWLTGFEVKHGQVPRYRHGRVFLAGDAAHIHSPVGGQGMNTGMQDAANLSWKLAAAVSGDGGQSLLDSYHTERHPIAKKVISFTSALTRAGTLRGPVRKVRNTAAAVVGRSHFLTERFADTLAELTVAYPHSPIIRRQAPRGAVVTAGHRFPYVNQDITRSLFADAAGHTMLTVAGVAAAPAPPVGGRRHVLVADGASPVDGYDAVVADPHHSVGRRLGLTSGGHVLCRPDGYIGAVLALGDEAGIADYYATLER